ncbi:MAG: glycosyltransferase family 4 protein [Bdellovibrionales bacterium]|nr:glycosyltransferase family 4 protein [Bdellovibrionales bacterium]
MAFFNFRGRREIPESINICMITRKIPTIGFLIPAVKGLLQQGHHVGLIAQTEADLNQWLLPEGLKMKAINTKGLSRKQAQEKVMKAFKELHKEEPFHVVHSMDAAGQMIGESKKKLGVSMVYDIDATHLNHMYSIIGLSQDSLRSFFKTSFLLSTRFIYSFLRYDRKLLKTADALFVHSNNQRMAMERYFLYPDRRIFSVPYGLQIDDLSKREKSGELLAKLKLPQGSQIVMTSTDMIEFAELKSLIRAFEQVAVKKNNARMVILGSGPLFKQVEYEVLSRALGRRVVFAGEVPAHQLTDYICLADVFVNLSSRTSVAEQSLIEAMAQEKVVIASEVSAVSSVITQKSDGFLIRPADYDSLADLLFKVFNSEIEDEKMGKKARETVLNLFDSQKMVKQTLSGYELALRR